VAGFPVVAWFLAASPVCSSPGFAPGFFVACGLSADRAVLALFAEPLAAASFLASGWPRASAGPVPLARPRPTKKPSVCSTEASDFLKI